MIHKGWPVPLTRPQLEGESLKRLRALTRRFDVDPEGLDRAQLIAVLLAQTPPIPQESAP